MKRMFIPLLLLSGCISEHSGSTTVAMMIDNTNNEFLGITK
jgi:hypothetical protein